MREEDAGFASFSFVIILTARAMAGLTALAKFSVLSSTPNAAA